MMILGAEFHHRLELPLVGVGAEENLEVPSLASALAVLVAFVLYKGRALL